MSSLSFMLMRGEEGSGIIDPSLLNLLVLRVLSLLHLRISFRSGKRGEEGKRGGGLRRKLVPSQNTSKKKEENCSLGGGKGGKSS